MKDFGGDNERNSYKDLDVALCGVECDSSHPETI
jgi:hypothetical protein